MFIYACTASIRSPKVRRDCHPEEVEQVHKLHVGIVLPDSLAAAPVFVRDAQASQYQQAPGAPLAQVVRATEWQLTAKRGVSVP